MATYFAVFTYDTNGHQDTFLDCLSNYRWRTSFEGMRLPNTTVVRTIETEKATEAFHLARRLVRRAAIDVTQPVRDEEGNIIRAGYPDFQITRGLLRVSKIEPIYITFP